MQKKAFRWNLSPYLPHESGAKMIEGLDADTVQIVSENELKALKTYVEKNKLKVDMDSLENGTGVMIIHDHKLSQKQGRQAEKAVGETVCLSPLKNKETRIRWNSMTDKERDKEGEIIKAETPDAKPQELRDAPVPPVQAKNDKT